MSTCRGCDAEIVWCLTANGRKMPVDRRPDPKGNLYLLGGSPVVAVVTNSPLGRAIFDEAPEKKTYTPHHATCPQVGRFR